MPDVRCLLSTQITWVILFTRNRRYFVVVVFDADSAAAPQRGVYVLVMGGVRGHKVQQTLQQGAHPLCGAQILHQAVLVHLVGITGFEVHEQEAKLALADKLEQFFDLFRCEAAADLFQYRLAFKPI